MVVMCPAVAVVLAVKSLDAAKTRLTPLPVPPVTRPELVTAMLSDTLSAVRATAPGNLIVVSPDPAVHAAATEFGAISVPEPTYGDIPDGWSPLNCALAHGAASAPPDALLAYLQADLPALRPASFIAAVDRARTLIGSGAPAAFVSDHSGSGTVLLVAGAGFAPAFGADSAAAHRAAGAAEVDPRRICWPDLRTDIDTPADLALAQTIGLGDRTSALLAQSARQQSRDAAQ